MPLLVRRLTVQAAGGHRGLRHARVDARTSHNDNLRTITNTPTPTEYAVKIIAAFALLFSSACFTETVAAMPAFADDDSAGEPVDPKPLLDLSVPGQTKLDEHGKIVGVHLGSWHGGNLACNNGYNPGLYFSDVATGFTAGTYHNSCERQSYYIGVKTPDWHGLSLMVMGVTGYFKPVTLVALPMYTVPLQKDDSLRISGGKSGEIEVIHFSVDRKF
jgi:hypothetical protein